MSSPVELIIDLEDPTRHVQILGYQLRERMDKFLLVVDVHATYRCWDVSQLKDFLGS